MLRVSILPVSRVLSSRECLGSWPALEHLMMKSSMLFECGFLSHHLPPPPPMSTLCPLDVIHMISVPRPSLFFAGLPLPYANQKWRRPGNEANVIHSHVCSRKVASSLVVKVMDCRPMVSGSSSRCSAFRVHSVLPQQLRFILQRDTKPSVLPQF